jgi:hypothetical protein
MTAHNGHEVAPGNTVVSSDGKKLGVVSAVDDEVMRVEKGFLFVKDYLIPHSAVASVDSGSGEVHLSYTADEAAATDWIVTDEEREEAEEEDYDSPLDGDGSTVLAGAASMPNPLILEETTEAIPDEKIEDYQ